MPQIGNFTPVTPTHLTPIDCPSCGNATAHLSRLLEAVTGDGKGEIRVFECFDCEAITEMFVRNY